MIETRLSLGEARYLLQVLDLKLAPESPLADPLGGAAEVPAGSTAEAGVTKSLTSRGLLLSDGAPNPFAAAAMVWLAQPEKAWTLSLFGRGGAAMVHLAFKGGSAVECRRDAEGFLLRYPLPEAEAEGWLRLHLDGGPHDS